MSPHFSSYPLRNECIHGSLICPMLSQSSQKNMPNSWLTNPLPGMLNPFSMTWRYQIYSGNSIILILLSIFVNILDLLYAHTFRVKWLLENCYSSFKFFFLFGILFSTIIAIGITASYVFNFVLSLYYTEGLWLIMKMKNWPSCLLFVDNTNV